MFCRFQIHALSIAGRRNVPAGIYNANFPIFCHFTKSKQSKYRFILFF